MEHIWKAPHSHLDLIYEEKNARMRALFSLWVDFHYINL